MARSEIAYTVQQVTNGGGMFALNGASVEVLRRDTVEDEAVVYRKEVDDDTWDNPLTTDSAGRIEGWIEPGKYILRINHALLTAPYDQAMDVVDPVGGAPGTMRVDLAEPFGVAENQPNDIPFTIHSPGKVAGVELSLYVESEGDVGDLTIDLISPGAGSVTIPVWGQRPVAGASPADTWGAASKLGAGPEDGNRLHFAMDGLTLAKTISQTLVVTPGRIKPVGDFNSFAGKDIEGDWILRVTDHTTDSNLASVRSASLFIAPHYQAFLPNHQDFYDEALALSSRPKINFTGVGVTATDNAGQNRTDVTIPGIVVYENGTVKTEYNKLNFKASGGGVTVAATDDTVNKRTDITVTVPSPVAPAIQVQEDTVDKGSPRGTLDFSGNVTVNDTGSKVTVALDGVSVQESGSFIGIANKLNFVGANDVALAGDTINVDVTSSALPPETEPPAAGGGGAYTTTLPSDTDHSISTNATGGTFKLTYAGVQTGTIAFNATAAQVSTALDALSNLAVTGTPNGDFSVSGTAINDSTDPVIVTFLTGGPNAITRALPLLGDGTALTGGTLTLTSFLDGVEIFYGAATGVTWHLRYNTTITDIYKWEFVGGSDLLTKNDTDLTASSTSYADLSTPVRIAVPVAGEYIAQIFSRMVSPVGGTPTQDLTMVPRGTETVADIEAIYTAWTTTNENNSKFNLISAPRRCTQTAAGGFISFMAKRGGGSWTVSAPRLWITPVRVG